MDKKNSGKRFDEKKRGDRKPYGEKKSFGDRKPYGEKKSFGDRKPYGEKKSFGDKPYGEKKSFGDKPYGEKKSFGDRKPYGEKKSFGDHKPYGEKKSFGDYKPYGEKKSFGDKPYGEKKSFGDKPYGEKKSFGDRKPYGEKKSFGDKPYGEKKSFGDRQPYGEKKSFGDKPYGEKKSFGDRKPYGEKKSFGDRKPYGEKKSFGDKSYGKKKSFGDRKPYGEKKSFGERRPYGERINGDKPFRPQSDVKRPFVERPAEANDAASERPVEQETQKRPASVLDARRVALNALADVNRVDAYAALALDKRLREAKLSGEDRRLATSIFYAAVENRLNIQYVLKDFMKTKPEPVVEDILHIACAQILFMDRIPAHAAVDEAVKQTRAFGREEAAGFVNGVLRSLLRAIEADEIHYPDTETEPIAYLSVKYSVPEKIVQRLIDAYGFETAAEIVSFRPAERLETVRANMMRMDDAAFEAFMTRRGWRWRKGTVPGAYLVEQAGNLANDPDYYSGEFSVQGESSMLAARAVEPRPGMTVLDACAAPGGKAALMCEMMRGTGRVHAWDLHEHRVQLIKAAGKRLHLDNLRPAERDASVRREDLECQMDAVLVDAPCSGLGVMTDKPDLKYRVTDESIESLKVEQKKILDACSFYVKVGGLLVYSTCSILPEENEKQVEEFLLNHPEFKMDEGDAWVPEKLKPRFQNGMLALLPCRDGVEGFFIARMRRVSL